MRPPIQRTLHVLFLVASSSCAHEVPQGQLYYERKIQPLLTSFCASATSGCHAADPADPFQFAAGNLDLTSSEKVHKRPDVLRACGTYPVPLLLIKAAGPTGTGALSIRYRARFLPNEIPHAGGGLLPPEGEAFRELE